MKKLIALFVVGLALAGCKYSCPPGFECPLPDEGTDYCPGCDDEVVEVELEIE